MNILTCVKGVWDTLTQTSDSTQPKTETKLTQTPKDERRVICPKCKKEATPEDFLAVQDGCLKKKCTLRKQVVVEAVMKDWKIEDPEELVPCLGGEIVLHQDKKHNGYVVHDIEDLDAEEAEYWRRIMAERDNTYGGMVF